MHLILEPLLYRNFGVHLRALLCKLDRFSVLGKIVHNYETVLLTKRVRKFAYMQQKCFKNQILRLCYNTFFAILAQTTMILSKVTPTLVQITTF
jgi:hypothetical protein